LGLNKKTMQNFDKMVNEPSFKGKATVKPSKKTKK
jgi:hypothetical protein